MKKIYYKFIELIKFFEEKKRIFLIQFAHRIANKKWHNNPIAKTKIGTLDDYLILAEKAKNRICEEVNRFESKKGFKIDRIWLQELALQTQVVIKGSELNYAHGRVLYSALRNYLEKRDSNSKNISIIETGTARGFSSLCMAKALKDSEVEGNIITFDVLPHRKKMFWNCIADHIVGIQTREELLKSWNDLMERYITFVEGYSQIELLKISRSRIHFAFLDGAHTFNDVMLEFKCIKNFQQKGDVIIFDDYNKNKFPEIVKAVDTICNKFSYSKLIINSFDGRSYVVAEKI